MKKVHLVCSPELILLITKTLESEGFVVSGHHQTIHKFINGFRSKEVDPSAIIVMQGGAGLTVPINSEELLGLMVLIRKHLKRTRLIVQLDELLQEDTEFIRSMVNMGIHDLQFTQNFYSDEIINWLKKKKSTRDFYDVLGKQKPSLQSLFSKKGEIKNNEVSDTSPPPQAVEVKSLSKASISKNQTTQTVKKQTQVSTKSTVKPQQRSIQARSLVSEEIVELDEVIEESPMISTNQSSVGGHIPLIIGISGVGGDEDVGAAAFLIAAGLAELGWKPLVCGDDRAEISSLEDMVFSGEKEDASSKMFEYEGVTFIRRGYTWDISELMTSGFSHIILWLDIQQIRKETNGIELWWNTQIPILVANGAMWKYELLKEKLETLTDYERKRCKLLLENGHQEVKKKLKNDFPEIYTSLIPNHHDPLYPDKSAVDWVMNLLTVEKKLLRKPVILWGIAGVIVFIALILFAIGIATVPDSSITLP